MIADLARDAKAFADRTPGPHPFGPFGEITLPFVEMGAITSLNLFDPGELAIFAFYWRNRKRYRKTADLGANLGLHSIVLDRAGYMVNAYEPDPGHFAYLAANLARNGCHAVAAHMDAVAARNGEHAFVRVLGNTTASHLAGAREFHGPVERFSVHTVAFKPILAWADLIKIDIEGSEADLICSTDKKRWAGADAIVEVGNPENATRIFEHCSAQGIGLFAARVDWQPIETFAQMPLSYKDGSLFVSLRAAPEVAGLWME